MSHEDKTNESAERGTGQRPGRRRERVHGPEPRPPANRGALMLFGVVLIAGAATY